MAVPDALHDLIIEIEENLALVNGDGCRSEARQSVSKTINQYSDRPIEIGVVSAWIDRRALKRVRWVFNLVPRFEYLVEFPDDTFAGRTFTRRTVPKAGDANSRRQGVLRHS